MQEKLTVQIETLSNLLIGGAPAPFEIGGIDQYTVTQDKLPYIPGSTLKGAVRNIVREDISADRDTIADLYIKFLQQEKGKNMDFINKQEPEVKKRMLHQYDKNLREKTLTAEALFGIEEFNNTPKLLFSDLSLANETDPSNCFSIDAKALIETEGDSLSSNPRTYKTARKGLVFKGEIRLYKIEKLDKAAIGLVRRYLCGILEQFNDGIHRLGNSKSRGYGKVFVRVLESSGVPTE